MNNVRETINTMLVKTFHEILELEEKAIITDEFSDISDHYGGVQRHFQQ